MHIFLWITCLPQQISRSMLAYAGVLEGVQHGDGLEVV